MFKKYFNTEKGCKTPFAVLEKQMVYIGHMMWVLVSEHPTAKERNEVLKDLREGK